MPIPAAAWAAAPAIAGVVSSITGATQARRQRQWETDMSNTAYQRAVADMKKAGLNPALMFGSAGPASTPNVPFPNPGEQLMEGVNSSIAAVRARQEGELLDRQNALLYEQKEKTAKETEALTQRMEQERATYDFLWYGRNPVEPMGLEARKRRLDIGLLSEETELVKERILATQAAKELDVTAADLNRVQKILREFDIPEAEWSAGQWRMLKEKLTSALGEDKAEWIQMLLLGAGPAGSILGGAAGMLGSAAGTLWDWFQGGADKGTHTSYEYDEKGRRTEEWKRPTYPRRRWGR